MIGPSQIAPDFQFAAGRGLAQGSANFHPESFGNAILVMVGLPFSFRFTRDRGQVTVDTSGNGRDWFDLRVVFDFLDKGAVESFDLSRTWRRWRVGFPETGTASQMCFAT